MSPMARDKKADKAGKEKKRPWYKLVGDGYKIAKKTYPALPWILLGVFLLALGLFLLIGWLTNAWIIWVITGIVGAPLITLIVLTRFIQRASYKQIDGMPGSVGAVIDQIRRGWNYSSEPVRMNAKTQDLLYRLIGKPGVVLVTEGPVTRVRRLVEDEKRVANRIAPNVPVHVVHVGNGEGQVPLVNLMKTINKLKKSLTSQEVAVVAKRFDSVKANKLPIPKGIDPYKMRPNRRAMRG